MEKLLTTKDLADAIGASESSLRRWTNSGAIRTSRTVGGHRRISLSEAIRFIRESHSTVVRPEVLGLELAESADKTGAGESLYQALSEGNAGRAQGEILRLYLDGSSTASIFDDAIRPCMTRMGVLWKHDDRGILVEHRATDICLAAINQLRQVLPGPAPGALVAVGGAHADDPYLLPTLMAAVVLAEVGIDGRNFGPRTPLDLLATAAEEHKASLVWLSISHADAPATIAEEIARLAARLATLNVPLALGGRHASDVMPTPLPGVTLLQSMRDLATFASGLNPAEPD